MAGEKQIYGGGEIYTADSARPGAEAVAVEEGRIVAVGSEAECRAALGEGYQFINLAGSVLLPGFIDTHMHPTAQIVYEMFGDLRGLKTIAALQDKIRELAEQETSLEWVIGMQFEDADLQEGRLPTRHDLDAACADRPVMILKHDGHLVILNTRAMQLLGLSKQTAAPAGGEIDREPDGFPLGPFRETASAIPLSALPRPPLEKITAAAKNAFGKISACGITSAGFILQTGEEGVSGKQGAFDLPMMTLLYDLIQFSTSTLLVARDAVPIEAARQTRLHNTAAGSTARINGLKFWADGTFGSCTALMDEGFSDHPERSGFLVLEEEEMYRRMIAAHTAGLQIGVHAVGDAANRLVVRLYERLLREQPKKDHRHRIEHASVLDTKTIDDIARLGLVVSTQPMFIHSEKTWLPRRLGPARCRLTYPFRSFIDAGVRLAGASDSPIESLDVLQAIQCCVTREGFEPQQGISAAEAVRMFTLDAAFAQFEETSKGSISVGKRADFVILSANPVTVSPDKIGAIRVEQTIWGGKTVFQRKRS